MGILARNGLNKSMAARPTFNLVSPNVTLSFPREHVENHRSNFHFRV